MRADNSRHIIAAARRRADHTRQRAITAMRNMDAQGQRITFESVAANAGVSRSWLYAQPDLRAEINRLRQRHQSPAASPLVPSQQQASSASLLRRLQAASSRIRRLEEENTHLRDALAGALGEQRAARILGGHASRDQADGPASIPTSPRQ
jgi:hypothetical protein